MHIQYLSGSLQSVNIVGQVAILLQSLAEHSNDEKNLSIIKKTVQVHTETFADINFKNQLDSRH